ncbi:putative acyltransferase [Yamadazyma tenuis]|uniref:putative acyltransferase n=1 Tax=Candida tenuis TaxID=2315449 RepID=UPI0027A50DFD|nr:putative acyltransferase [Yamadazyma tenuis]
MFWDVGIYFTILNGVNYIVTGDLITSESAVFISNHSSLVDHFAINYLSRHSFSKNKELEVPVVNFFTWFLLWKVPNINILRNMAKCDENWELDHSLNEVFFSKLFASKKVEWLVLFPEVNIFTAESSALQKIQCEKFYLPLLKNLLYPRFSSLHNVVSTRQVGEMVGKESD